jgi:integrase
VAVPATPATVANYLCRLADDIAAVATIERRPAPIAKAPRRGGGHRPDGVGPDPGRAGPSDSGRYPPPVGEDAAQAMPLALDRVARVLQSVPMSTNAGRRDRALVLLGFYGAFRRSELSALDVDQLLDDAGSVVVELRRTMTSQTEAVYLPIPVFPGDALCPVTAGRSWRDVANITLGCGRSIRPTGSSLGGCQQPASIVSSNVWSVTPVWLSLLGTRRTRCGPAS